MELPAALELIDITKTFPGVVANDRVSLNVRRGEVHALLGENGAGKTTLMNILYGLYWPDSGEIRLEGKPVRIPSPTRAIELGIGMVHQHFMLVEPLTVAENVVLGHEPTRSIFSLKRAVQITEELAQQYGLAVDARARIEDLPVGVRQRVEILKALYRKASILILDEPTAVLTPLEVEGLYATLAGLKAAGKTVIFISHKLNETMRISDRITILRDRRALTTLNTHETNPVELARLMVGREVMLRVDKGEQRPGASRLSLSNVSVRDYRKLEAVRSISLDVRAGEIYGIAGIEGNGQTELLEAITGLRPVTGGRISLDRQDLTHAQPATITAAGLGHVPEDRNRRGVVGPYSVAENMVLGYHRQPRFHRRRWLNRRAIASYAEGGVAAFDIRTAGVEARIDTLSGGNAQKVVLARVFNQSPKALVVAQPTRGVDVGAAEYIRQQMIRLRDTGVAILLISSDLDEVRSLSDRIGVLYQGRLVAERPADEFTEDDLGLFMAGATASALAGGAPQ